MKIAAIVFAYGMLAVAFGAAAQSAPAQAASSKKKGPKGGIHLNDPAPYCDRYNAKPFCSSPDPVKTLATVNDDLQKDIDLYKKAEARHFKPHGFDSWQEMYLEGQGLEGRHFSLVGGGSVIPMQNGAVLIDSNNCESPTMQLKIDNCVRSKEPASCIVEVVQGPSGVNICGQPTGGPSGVQIVKGYWNATGDWVPSDTEVTLSCNADGNEANKQQPAADGALARCMRYYNFKPSGGDKNKDLTACIRMQRADFCGDGKSLTFIGTYVDAHGACDPINPDDCSDGMCFEATWSARGAECVGHTRWTDLDYAQSCPDTFPSSQNNGSVHCRKKASISAKDLFTRSRINTCGKDPQDCGPDTVSPGCDSGSAKKGKKAAAPPKAP
jgi:hypothetical protein